MAARAAKWWGWGFDDVSVPLESRPALHALLRQVLELPNAEVFRVPDPASIALPPTALREADLAALRRVVGEDGLAAGHLDRLTHSLGRSYRDLVRLRLGRLTTAPDAVVLPEAEADVVRLLELCGEREWAVVPFGGGTSVVGGVEVADASRPTVTVDLRRMRRLLGIDEVSMTATAEAGVRGPLLEEALGAHGLTLGHAPQSFEFSTLGGWVASRSVGASSGRYGKIEDIVLGLRLAAPSGVLDLPPRTRHAIGPDLLSLVVGSEGTLGVITQATVRVHRVPLARAFDSFLLPGFREGMDILRALAQVRSPPHAAYLLDEGETRLAAAAAGGAKGLAGAYLRVRGASLENGSLLLLGYEGPPDVVRDGLAMARGHCRGAVGLGASPAERYHAARYETPYLRDSLIDHRIMVDTVETATVWSNLERLYTAARDACLKAIWGTGVQGIVGCHVSHVYPEGASLYFTWFARMRAGGELAQHEAVKSSVTRAILDSGGLLSHHHGVGADHAPWFREAVGDEAFRVLRDLKRSLDPKGIMNPGKLFAVTG